MSWIGLHDCSPKEYQDNNVVVHDYFISDIWSISLIAQSRGASMTKYQSHFKESLAGLNTLLETDDHLVSVNI